MELFHMSPCNNKIVSYWSRDTFYNKCDEGVTYTTEYLVMYHLQNDRLVEQFNNKLTIIEKDGHGWNYILPYLMFTIHKFLQYTLWFSPFELLYGS